MQPSHTLTKIRYITADELQQACEQFGLEDVQLEDIMREVDQDNVHQLRLIHGLIFPILSFGLVLLSKNFFVCVCGLALFVLFGLRLSFLFKYLNFSWLNCYLDYNLFC